MHGKSVSPLIRHVYPHAAAAGRVKGPRRAAATELHANAKPKRARGSRQTDRSHGSAHQAAEDLTVGQQRQKYGTRHGQHQHLRAHAPAAAVGDKRPPGRREAERRMVEDESRRGANQKQRALTPRERQRQIERAGGDQADRNRSRAKSVGLRQPLHYAPVKPPLRKTQPPRQKTAIWSIGVNPSLAPSLSEAVFDSSAPQTGSSP